MTSRGTPALSARGLRKAFPGVVALADASLTLRAGEVHALLGENGAGKSTLMKIFAGLHAPDGGELEVFGARAAFRSPREARERGIATIYQEFSLVPDLSIAENLFLGDEPLARGLPRFDAMVAEARALCGELSLAVDPRTEVRNLSVAEQQMVEIARALRQKSRVLTMDEPTAALSHRESEHLFAIVRRLKAEGVAVLYVSHRMPEVFALCDVATVLRDGVTVHHARLADTDEATLVNTMVGREVKELFPRGERAIGPVRLEVRGLRREGAFGGIDLEVRGGEIVGLAGLVGAGRTEVMRGIFGADAIDAGTVRVDGVAVPPGDPAAAVRAGLGLLTEDRKQEGLALTRTIRENVSLASLARLSPLGVVATSREREDVGAVTSRMRVRMASAEALAGSLSGGNQQKVLLARWLLVGCKVVLFDEPTRGIDVGARAEIYEHIHRLAASGLGILVVSSDLPEVIGLCDRVYVMSGGRIAGHLARAEASESAVLTLAMPKGTAA